MTPTRFRPASKVNDIQFEHPQNVHLVNILKSNAMIADLQTQETAFLGNEGEDLEVSDPKAAQAKRHDFLKRKVDTWIRLQTSVEHLIDSASAPSVGGKVAPPGIKQLLEKKEGTFTFSPQANIRRSVPQAHDGKTRELRLPLRHLPGPIH